MVRGIMGRKVISVALLISVLLVQLSLTSPEPLGAGIQQPVRAYSRIILISWDGARKFWVDRLVENATLRTLASLKAEGSYITVRIVSHITVTDPGLANIETGYGADVTGIDRNYFAAAEKKSIPKGLTIAERLKAEYGQAWKTALIMPWPQGPLDNPQISKSQDSTFWNSRPSIDYWFSSENISWRAYDPTIHLSYGSALLRASFVAKKAMEFIQAYARYNFYLRVHMVEPDTVGHAYSESVDGGISPAYKAALIEVDQAVGLIVSKVRELGIEGETAILVTTDHGFIGIGHSGPPYPDGDEEVTVVWLITNVPWVRNELGWALMDDIAPTVLALAGVDVEKLTPAYAETAKALPIWKASKEVREVNPPRILSVEYPEVLTAAMLFRVNVTAADESGIRSVRLWFSLRDVDLRYRNMNKVGENLYSTQLGPFPAGTRIKWYIQVIDNSISFNFAFYPEKGKAMVTEVKEAPAPAKPPSPALVFITQTELLAILAVGVAVAGLIAAFYLRRRAKGSLRGQVLYRQ